MTFAQYIVFIEEMYESAVNNNAEDFPKVTVDTYSTVVMGGTFVDWGDQSLVPNIGEDARAKVDVKEIKYSQLEFVVCIFYNFMGIPSTPQAFLGWRVLFCPVVHSR